jgi:outer membrane protein OmpA-like peptidoglycan-associated protein
VIDTESEPPALPQTTIRGARVADAVPVAQPPPFISSVESTEGAVGESEKKEVKAEVLTRIEFMKISAGNKDRLHSAVETARDMRKILIIPFDSGKTDLSADFRQQIQFEVNKAEVLKMRADPSAVFVILGYADLRGTAEINKVYSQRRADIVRDALRDECGVLNVMYTFGMGASKLLDANSLAKNRITEIWVVLP